MDHPFSDAVLRNPCDLLHQSPSRRAGWPHLEVGRQLGAIGQLHRRLSQSLLRRPDATNTAAAVSRRARTCGVHDRHVDLRTVVATFR